MEWFRDAGAGLVALDLGVDTSTPAGHEVAATLITLGDWERERIARRTRSGLAEVARERPPDRPAVGQRPARPGRAHHRDARRQHDPAGHRRPAQRRGRPHPAWGSHVAAVERPGGARLPPPGHPYPPRPVPHSGRQGVDECANSLRNGCPCKSVRAEDKAIGSSRRGRRHSSRTREEWRAFASEHDRCLEPVLELDEALSPTSCARERWWWSSTSPGARRLCGCSASRSI